MSFSLKTTHIADALDLLITQYKDKPNMQAYLKSFLTQIQELEQVFYDIFTKLLIDNAEGDQLDILGAIVGLERGEMDDAEYKLRIKVKVLVNKSCGTADQLLKIVGMLSSLTPEIEMQYPAALVLRTNNQLTVSGSVIADILNKAKTGGVRAIYEWFSGSTPFLFGDGATSTNGFGNGTFANAQTGE